MTNFEIPAWETNAIGDNACKDVFKIKHKPSKKKSKKLLQNLKKQTTMKLEHRETLAKLEKKTSLLDKIHQEPRKQNSPIKLKKNKKPKLEKAKTNIDSHVAIKRKSKKKKKHASDDDDTNHKISDKSVQTERCNNVVKHAQTETTIKVEKTVQKNMLPTKEYIRLQKIKEKIKNSLEVKTSKVKWQQMPLRERMMEKLKGARFRYLNEEIYTKESKETVDLFQKDPASYKAYHEGYRQQVLRWPLNPLDNIIKSIKKMPSDLVVADFGCGEARLSESVPHTVHSFDLVASNDTVVACDMAKVPLPKNSVDVAVFCLSLMGTNLVDYLLEANRVLKLGGILKIAEVESRFDTLESFVSGVERLGFKMVWKDLSHNLFYFLDFKKEAPVKKKNKLPAINLQPCLYKKR